MSPSSDEIVGPVPSGRDPDEYDRLRRRVLWAMPTGLFVVGTRGGEGSGRYNLMTANWCLQVAIEPKMVAVAVEASAVTAKLLDEGGAFAVNLLRRSDRALVRRFVKPVSDIEHDAAGAPTSMAGQPVRTGTTGAPILSGAIAWVECECRHRLPLGSHVVVVGEVVDVGGDELTAGQERPEDEERSTEILRMEDTRMNYGG